MDNRDNKDLKTYTPATAPVIRSRQRSAAAAQAAMQAPETPVAQAAPAAPMQAAAAAFSQPLRDTQAPTMRKRSAGRSLSAPIIYEPRRDELPTPTVAPVAFHESNRGLSERSAGVMMFISTLMGIASGILLLVLNDSNGLLRGTGVTDFGDTGMIIHCLLWGGILGFVCSLIYSIFYEKLPSALPVYASMLYMPVLMFFLMPLMCLGTELVIGIVTFIIGLIGAGIALFLAWTFICGG